MTYRDELTALRERNAALERELEALRAERSLAPQPQRRAPRGLVRVALAVIVLGTGAALFFSTERASSTIAAAPSASTTASASPSPPEAASHAPRPLSGLTALATAKGGAMEPISRVFTAVVTRASSGAPVREGDACSVGVQRGGDICFVTATCGAWSPFPNRAVTACTIDDHGLPHGGIHMGPTTGQPTAITMDGTRFELADDREDHAYLVTMQLGDARPK
jgi:hypothetical protein